MNRDSTLSMRPLGGPTWKNLAAYALVRSGGALRENRIDMSRVNERIPPLPGRSIENYNDSFVFEGSDANGNLIMTRLGFREDGSTVEVWVWMVLGGRKLAIPLDITKLASPTGRELEALGLSYECIDRRNGTFRIRYRGPLEAGVTDATVDLVYTPCSSMYHSGQHMNAWTFARSMAEMPWSRDYFRNLSSESQCRVEQGGSLRGKVVLDGETFDIDMLSIRDHSWGKRNWSFCNRYIWNVISLESDLVIGGDPFRYLVFTTVDYGTSFRHLVTGWIAGERSVLPIVEASDMGLLGSDGRIPPTFVTRFRAEGGPVMKIITERNNAQEHSWLTGNGSFEICEAYCSVDVAGVRGHGMSEFGYARGAGYDRPFER